MPCSTVACILESKWFAVKLFLTPNLKKIFERGGVSTKYSQNLLLTHYSKIITTNVAAHFQSRT